jgi:hypothetical protein
MNNNGGEKVNKLKYTKKRNYKFDCNKIWMRCYGIISPIMNLK